MDQQRGALWIVAAPLILFKVGFIVLLLIYAPTRDSIDMLIVTQWPTVVVVLALVAGPGIAWWRLVRVRRRRDALRRSEWMLDDKSRARSQQTGAQWPLWETISGLDSGE